MNWPWILAPMACGIMMGALGRVWQAGTLKAWSNGARDLLLILTPMACGITMDPRGQA